MLGGLPVLDRANFRSIYIQVHLKKINILKRSIFSESETHILYRFSTHRVTYFKPLFLEMLMIVEV